jgi:opacity protein-like surface antigen
MMMRNGLNRARIGLGAIMRNTVVLSMLVSSVASAAVTALVVVAMLPSAVDAQVAWLTGSSLTVAGPNGLPGVTAEVGPPGGGIPQVVGSDGKTVRLSLNSSGQPTDGGIAANAGLNVYNVDGLEVVRVGSNQALNGYAFTLRDAQGTTRYRAAVDGDGNPAVQLFDAQGNVIWSTP